MRARRNGKCSPETEDRLAFAGIVLAPMPLAEAVMTGIAADVFDICSRNGSGRVEPELDAADGAAVETGADAIMLCASGVARIFGFDTLALSKG